jgi:alpha-beta hydrolase superfamily lysophospholipase
MLRKKSYKKYNSWKKFQPFFPERSRITDEFFPTEEYWRWNNMLVHIDRYIPKKKKDLKVILIHGGGANGRMMSPIGIGLLKKGYECIAPDLPGFGLTDYSRPIGYKVWIDLVVDLIKEESKKDDTPIALMGISLGGMLAYQVACLSTKVKGLMVTTLADTTKLDIQRVLARNDFAAIAGGKAINLLKKVTDNIKVPIKETTRMERMANNPEFVKLLKKDKVGSGSWVYLKWLRTLQSTSAAIRPEDFNQCPVLFLHPEKDTLLSFEHSKPFFDKLTCNKELVYLTNCGHIPMEEPGVGEMEDAIQHFLRKIRKSIK